MSILEKKVRLTTLRNLGAFQIDALDTQKVAAIDAFDTQKIKSTNIKAFPSREATDSLASSKAKLEGPPTAIIPFPTSSTPLKERQRQKVDYQQRATTIVEKAKKKKWVKFAARVGCTLLLFVFLFKSLSWSTWGLWLVRTESWNSE